MYKIVTALAILAVTVGCVIPTECKPQKQITIQEAARSQNAVWQVMTRTGSGSMTHIGGGYFLSAAHVFNQLDEKVSITQGGEAYIGSVLKLDVQKDLALVYCEQLQFKPMVIISSVKPKLGDRVIGCGYTFGLFKLTSFGRVSTPWDANHITHNASMNSGCSGGAMFNDKGQLVGVIVSMHTRTGDWSGFGHCVGYDWIKEFLEIK